MRQLPLALTLVLSLAAGAKGDEVTVTQGEEAAPVTVEPTFLEGGGARLTDGLYSHPNAEVSTAYQTNVFYNDPCSMFAVASPRLEFLGWLCKKLHIRFAGSLAPGAAPPGDMLSRQTPVCALTKHQPHPSAGVHVSHVVYWPQCGLPPP